MAEGGPWRDKSDHDRIQRNSGGLYRRHFLHVDVQCEIASAKTCTLMNCLGYGSHIRQTRRDAYREHSTLINASMGGEMMITTGSKAEGLTSLFEREWDQMYVVEGIMCLEEDVNSDTLPRQIIVFTLDTGLCYHGHSRLTLLEKRGSIISTMLRDALCDDGNGNVLLSSDLFVNKLDAITEKVPGVVSHERAGPSRPSSMWALHFDRVMALPCHCPGILLRWAERSRHWSPPDIVHKVVKMGAVVTPVGFKGSEYQHVEWRICFNKGENELMSSLNNIQVYIYVILKMVVKDVLKPVKKEITSYTVKNIVFWLAESNPQAHFDESSLFYWLLEGLGQLRKAILKIHLPYYMIPERNLMAACGLGEEQKRIWVENIKDMMNEGQHILLKLPKIRQAIISHPEPLLWYRKKRLELELLLLKNMNRQIQCKDENGVVNEADPMLQAIKRRYIDIMMEVDLRMDWEGRRVESVDDQIQLITMMMM